MFSRLKNLWFVGAVKAELMAQHKNQAFVDRICHLPTNRALLDFIRETAYFRRTKMAPFLAVCALLAETIDADGLAEADKKLCASLLAQRLLKVSEDSDFRLAHLMFIGPIEEKLADSRFARAVEV